MANNFQNITSGLAELKNFYQGPIKDQFNEDCAIYRAAEVGKESWSGYQVVRPLRVIRNQGIGATSDGGNLPDIGHQTTVQATVQSAFLYLRFGLTGPMIKASQNDKGSFVRSAQYEIEMGYKDLQSDANRQVSYDGTGYLASCSAAATASTTITVIGRDNDTTEDGNKFLDTGMILDIVTTAGVYKAQGVTITAVSGTTTATVSLDTPVTVASGDRLVRAGSYNQEVDGLLAALDGLTTSIYGVNRATYPTYQGNVDNLSGGQLTLDLMQATYNKGMRRGGAKYSAAYCDYDSLRMYQKLLTADKRYSNTVKGDGGFANKDQFYLDFNGLPMVPDKDCPRRIFFLPGDAVKKYVLSEMEFADETGTMYIAQTGTDQLEVRVRLFFNLFNEQPNACGVLRNYISP